MSEQLTLCIWETAVERRADGSVTLRPLEPLSTMDRRQAARVLGVSEWTVGNLYRAGLISGYKPGARVRRRDGRGSNAKLRLDSGSVLIYKRGREAESQREREV